MTDYWDIHNHILPGLDDGSSCDEETFAMLAKEYEQGVRHIIFTPHYRKGMFEVSAVERIDAFTRITEAYREKYAEQMPGMEFFLGCELHIHPAQVKKAAEAIYRMPGESIVLVEFAARDDFDILRKFLQDLLLAGYTCIIAHVERYNLDLEDIRELHTVDNLFIQVNAGSILGEEGLKQMLFTRKLLKEHLVDFVASDAHGIKARKVDIGKCAGFISLRYGEQYTKQLFEENPAEMFRKEKQF